MGTFVALDARATPSILAKLLLEGHKYLEPEQGRRRAPRSSRKGPRGPLNSVGIRTIMRSVRIEILSEGELCRAIATSLISRLVATTRDLQVPVVYVRCDELR
jgi:hypothetical protein